MSKALELRTERFKLVEEMKAINESATKLEGEKLARWNTLDAAQKELLTQIERVERTDALDAEMRNFNRPENPAPGRDTESRLNPLHAAQTRATEIQASDEYRDSFRSYLRTGKEAPIVAEMRTYSGMADGGTGAQLVPIGFQKELEVRLKAIGGVRQVARTITTAMGNTLNWPTMDDTANSGRWLTEATAVTQTNPTFGNVALTSNLASSDQVLCSVQLLQDSAFDVEAFLLDAFAWRLQRLTNLGYTSGTGSGQPNGLITALVAAGTQSVSAVGAYNNNGVAGQDGSVSIGTDDLDNLIMAVDPAYRANGTFMANQATWDALRKVKDKYGRSIWDAGLSSSDPDTIRGYKYIYNQQQPTIAPNAVGTVVFGDFSKYIIRDVLGFTAVRFNELFMGSHQVGFQAFLRTDGQLLQNYAFSYLVSGAS